MINLKNKKTIFGAILTLALGACGGFVYTTVGGNVKGLTTDGLSTLYMGNEANFTSKLIADGPFSFKVASRNRPVLPINSAERHLRLLFSGYRFGSPEGIGMTTTVVLPAGDLSNQTTDSPSGESWGENPSPIFTAGSDGEVARRIGLLPAGPSSRRLLRTAKRASGLMPTSRDWERVVNRISSRAAGPLTDTYKRVSTDDARILPEGRQLCSFQTLGVE